MMCLRFVKFVLAAAVLVGVSLPASAQYVLNDGGSAFADSSGPFGTVDLTDLGANVLVTVNLSAGFNFVTTGNQNSHASFTFNASGVSLSDIVSISAAGGGGYAAWAPGNNSPFGEFDFGIYCSNCRNGGPGAQLPPLTFTVLNAEIADLVFLSTGGDPNALFSADIIGNGVTGAVGVTTPPIPEPETYALMLAGLGAVAFMARRRRQI